MHHHHQQDSSTVVNHQVYSMGSVPDQPDHFESDGSDDDQADNNNSSNSGIDLDLSANSDLRKLTMESTDTLELLAAKTNSEPPGAAADKIRSMFVTRWLLESYEVEEDHNVPRGSMYTHYLLVCQQQGVRPVNSASFGKLIRTVFPDLKTRRLGTRGQYNYCGIRIKNSANPARRPTTTQQRTIELPGGTAHVLAMNSNHDASMPVDGHQPPTFQSIDQQSMYGLPSGGSQSIGPGGHHIQSASTDEKVARLPDFPPVLESSLPPGANLTAAQKYYHYYQLHCQTLLEKIQMMQFLEAESAINRYWQELTPDEREIADREEMIEYIWRGDTLLYETVMSLLLPNVLQLMPISVIQAVRHFARQLEPCIVSATTGYSQLLCSRKVEVARMFTQQLRRHTSLNHLAQAAAAVLESPEQMAQMTIDWSRIDFENIRDQASWVCECRKADIMQNMEVDFKTLLTSGNKLEHWTSWLENVVIRFLDEKETPQHYVYNARQFLMKWSFYSSLAIRDLTMKSAESFGSFHIMRLFFDEYIFYLVEQRIASVNIKQQMQP